MANEGGATLRGHGTIDEVHGEERHGFQDLGSSWEGCITGYGFETRTPCFYDVRRCTCTPW